MAKKQLHTIEVSATPEEVWRYITEAENIIRWFAPEARVTPGVGGSIFISWGAGMEGEAPIHLWEPNKALGWTEAGPHPKLVEFTIEAKDGSTTILRIVQSGFGEGSSFNDEYEAVNGGWQTYMRTLKFGIENTRHEPITIAAATLFLKASREDVSARLDQTFGFNPPLATVPFGGTITSTLGFTAQRLEPEKPGYHLFQTNNTLIALFLEQMGDSCFTTLQSWLQGPDAALAEPLKSAFATINTAASPSE